MLFMITILLAILVAVNFLLLRFSCNKSSQKESYSKPFVVRKQHQPSITTSPASTQLAPTGS